MLSSRPLFAAIVCSLALFLCPFLHGQATGSISGTVSDPTGAVVSGAKVTITAQAIGLSREAKTDEQATI